MVSRLTPAKTRPPAVEVSPSSESTRLMRPLFSARESASRVAVVERLEAADESATMEPPASETFSPMARLAGLSVLIPVRVMGAEGPEATRRSAPSPEPGRVALPSSSGSAEGVEAVPAGARSSASAARTRFSRATRTRSGPTSGEPTLSTVRLRAVVVTKSPSAVAVRKPPISRLAAPNWPSTAESSRSTPSAGEEVEEPSRMSSELEISTWLPRPSEGAPARPEPPISSARVAEKASRPASIGRRGTTTPASSEASAMKVLAEAI